MGKRILKGTQVGISTPKRQRHNSPVDIKKKKSAYEKEDKKIALPMCEKNGPDSPSGLARTARSARLRFCLFRRFVFYTRRMLVSASAASRLVQDKHTPKCQRGKIQR